MLAQVGGGLPRVEFETHPAIIHTSYQAGIPVSGLDTILDLEGGDSVRFERTLRAAELDPVQQMVAAQTAGLGLRKTRSAGYGDKSRSARDGGTSAANDFNRRVAA